MLSYNAACAAVHKDVSDWLHVSTSLVCSYARFFGPAADGINIIMHLEFKIVTFFCFRHAVFIWAQKLEKHSRNMCICMLTEARRTIHTQVTFSCPPLLQANERLIRSLVVHIDRSNSHFSEQLGEGCFHRSDLLTHRLSFCDYFLSSPCQPLASITA